jgi:hypothetical protein
MNYSLIVRQNTPEEAIADFREQFDALLAEHKRLITFKGETRWLISGTDGQPITDRDGIDPNGYVSEKRALAAIEALPLEYSAPEQAICDAVVALVGGVDDTEDTRVVVMVNGRLWTQEETVSNVALNITVSREPLGE